MAKSIEELRNLLNRLKSPGGAPAPAPTPAEAPVREARPEPAPRAPSSTPPAPAQARRNPASTPRPFRDEIAASRSEDERPLGGAFAGVSRFKLLLIGSAAALSAGGLIANNRIAVALGLIGLAVVAAWGGGSQESSAEVERLAARVAALERRLSSHASSPGSGELPADLAEEIRELRSMVKSLYKVLENEPVPTKGDNDNDSDAS